MSLALLFVAGALSITVFMNENVVIEERGVANIVSSTPALLFEQREMGGLQTSHQEGLPLQVPFEETIEERSALMKAIVERFHSGNPYFVYRDIYEEYLDAVGANGLISSIETLFPSCHSEGHDLGKVIYAQLNNIGEALRTCQKSCYSGCLHGVLMEAFTGFEEEEKMHDHAEEVPTSHRHVAVDDVRGQIEGFCDRPEVSRLYKIGDCVHGVGHALMYLSDYDIPKALALCELLEDKPLIYYCATGAYMEYVTLRAAEDAETHSLFYPCDTQPYPAACFRYKMTQVIARHYQQNRTFEELVEYCSGLNKAARLGCFHGLGNAHIGYVALQRIRLADLCQYGSSDDQYVCIEGAVERLAKYHPEKAAEACASLQGWQNELCQQGLKNKMYPLDKSFELYLK